MDKEDVAYMYKTQYYSAIKNEWNWVICIDMDGPRVCHREWTEKEKNKYCILIYICGI